MPALTCGSLSEMTLALSEPECFLALRTLCRFELFLK